MIYSIFLYYLEITAVFEGVFVDTHCKMLLNHILSNSSKRKVDQMGFFNGEVDVRKEGEEFSFGHHSAGQGDFQTLGGFISRERNRIEILCRHLFPHRKVLLEDGHLSDKA